MSYVTIDYTITSVSGEGVTSRRAKDTFPGTTIDKAIARLNEQYPGPINRITIHSATVKQKGMLSS